MLTTYIPGVKWMQPWAAESSQPNVDEYILSFFYSLHTYIGCSTRKMQQRWKEHMTGVGQLKIPIYKMMRRIGHQSFVMIPLVAVRQQQFKNFKESVFNRERFLIDSFCPTSTVPHVCKFIQILSITKSRRERGSRRYRGINVRSRLNRTHGNKKNQTKTNIYLGSSIHTFVWNLGNPFRRFSSLGRKFRKMNIHLQKRILY